MKPSTSHWSLALSCGHTAKRPAVWRLEGRTNVAKYPPARALCHVCPKIPRLDREDAEPLAAVSNPPKSRVLRATLRAGNLVLIELRFTPRKIGPVSRTSELSPKHG